jgi:hypothetical protein
MTNAACTNCDASDWDQCVTVNSNVNIVINVGDGATTIDHSKLGLSVSLPCTDANTYTAFFNINTNALITTSSYARSGE